jgi:Kef-type K+ transport system membrane component KefB
MRVLTELKKQSSDESQIVLGAAVIDDIIGIVVLSVLYEFSHGAGVSLFSAGRILLFILLFLILSPIAAKLISGIIKHYAGKSAIPGLIPSTTVALILFFAWLAHLVGAPELLGGFAAGIALSRQFTLPLGSFFHIGEEFSHKVEREMKPIIHLFAPIFFFTIGLSLNFREINFGSSFIWLLTLSALIAAVLGKLLSGFALFKEKTWIKWAVGIAMIPRGEVGLIFAEMGKNASVFDKDIYAAMILVIAITTLFTPFVMRAFYSRHDDKEMSKKT